MKTAVLQYAPGEDKTKNFDEIDRLVRSAHTQGVELQVLPEYAIYTAPNMDQRFVDNAEPLDGPSVDKLLKLSEELSTALIVGINESADDSHIHNTLLGINNGEIEAIYRKVHLYDAFGYKESAHVLAAEPSEHQLMTLNGFTVGMQTCYDLRFPEVSRSLIDAGADVLALPAEWVPGPLKEFHWNTLIRARAIENTAYVLASDQSAPTGVGNSAIIDPMGNAVAAIGDGSGHAIAEVSRERLNSVREANPALSLRRYAVSPKGA